MISNWKRWKITDSAKTLEEAGLALDKTGEIVAGHGWEDTKEDAVVFQELWLLETEKNQKNENQTFTRSFFNNN